MADRNRQTYFQVSEAAERMKLKQCSPYFKPAEQFQLLRPMTEDARRVLRNEYQRHAIAANLARVAGIVFRARNPCGTPPGLRGKP
jgi:hypothetical protein